MTMIYLNIRDTVQYYKQLFRYLNKCTMTKKIATSGNQINTIWDIVKEATGRTREEHEQVRLGVAATLVTDGHSVAHLFNTYFLSVTDSMRLSGSVHNALDYLKLAFTNSFTHMNMSVTSPHGISSTIRS